MKNLLKSIITTVLIAAITVTGISVDMTTVAAKTTKGGEFQNGGAITMKPGDTLKLTLTDTNKVLNDSWKTDYDIVEQYKWSSSDTSVVTAEVDFYDEDVDWTTAVVLNATGSGTATVTGKPKGPLPTITMTVNVSLPKATAKQKKCKHKFKTTKKATCERAGIKTCKKCKLQKAVKTTGHKFVTKTITETAYKYFTEDYKCHGDGCKWRMTLKFDERNNIISDENYPSWEEFCDALDKHVLSSNLHNCGTYGNSGYRNYYDPYEVEVEIYECKNCGYQTKKK